MDFAWALLRQMNLFRSFLREAGSVAQPSFLAWSVTTGHLRPGLIAAAALFSGNVLGRVVGLGADGVPEPPGLLLLGFELFGFVLVSVALVRREVPAA